ncbi:MAG TPA: ATPase, T2SS/T4P/T4SS family [Candidatus Saccharimonadales bacterium]
MNQDARQGEELATQRRAQVLGFGYADTSAMPEKPLFMNLLSVPEMYQARVVPLRIEKGMALFGITTTTSQQVIHGLQQRFNDVKVTFAIISDTGYKEYMRLYDPPKKVEYHDIAIGNSSDTALLKAISDTIAQVRPDDVLAYLVQQAFRLKASDIHLENQEEGVRIRFRVDGVLHVIAWIDHEKSRSLLSVIASAANISTSAADPQTGHINKRYRMATGEDVAVNLRVETVAAAYGQDAVMRLFSMKLELLNLDKLSLSARERNVVNHIIAHPTGMVLIVGPTGSGKTTTVYSLINTLNTDERKIITLEDPIEYFLKGIVQIPVKGDENTAGFAERLRAVLRLDPDVVMIGEIRDQDTAKTALQAALTGHLVLSTFHASSAAAALTRMLDFVGINPLFASAMHLIMAQRLVRVLDDKTKQAYQPDEALRARLQEVISTLPQGVERPNINSVTLYKPVVSPESPFGYTGQMPLREQLQMTPGIQQLLKLPPNQVTTEMLEKKAIEDGMVTMLQDGVLKACAGITSIEEVYRVVG